MRDKRRKREPEQRSFLFSLEEEAKLIDRRFFKHVPPPPSPPPRRPVCPFSAFGLPPRNDVPQNS